MNNRPVNLWLHDIENNIQKIEKFTSGGWYEFQSSDLIQFAILKCIENIGEAVKNLDEETKNLIPCMKWQQIARTRDYFVHHYFAVDLKLVWEIVETHIPILKASIEKIILAQKEPPPRRRMKM